MRVSVDPGCHTGRLESCLTWGGDLVDVEVSRGWITRVAPAGDGRVPVAETWDAQGELVLPGLWDHHIHAEQAAIAAARVPLWQAEGPAGVIGTLAAALAERGGTEALTGYGFQGAGWLAGVTAADLDAVSAEVPVVAISFDWHSAWLNTAALKLARTTQAVSGDGVVREEEWFELAGQLNPHTPEAVDALMTTTMAAAAARGVVGVIDMEKGSAWRAWRRRFGAGFAGMRVAASVWSDGLDDAIAEGMRTGDLLVPGNSLGLMGPLKIIADGSLNSRTACCRAPYPGGGHGCLLRPATELTELLARARGAGIKAAVHAIGDRAAGEVLRAFSASGATGTIEHAQLLEVRDIRRMARQGLAASIQPQHLVDDRDLVEELWAAREGRAYPYRDLAAAGVRLMLGSDAPVAPLDPWQAIASAVFRTDGTRGPWHPGQRLPLELALSASMPLRYRGAFPSQRLVPQVGDPADLILLEHDPREAGPAELRDLPVSSTMVAGRWTHGER